MTAETTKTSNSIPKKAAQRKRLFENKGPKKPGPLAIINRVDEDSLKAFVKYLDNYGKEH